LVDRRELASELRRLTPVVAEEVTVRLTRNRTGQGRASARVDRSDIEAHLQVLATALEFGSVLAFERHARWTASVLSARDYPSAGISLAMEEIAGSLHRRLPQAHGAWRIFFDAAVNAASSPRSLDTPNITGWRNWKLRNTFLVALLQGDRRLALSVCLEALAGGRRLAQIYEELVQDAMYEVGVLWETNQISAAEEHLATNVAQSTMAELFAKIPLPPEEKSSVLVACVQHEHHSLGAQMASDILSESGFRARCLGANVPLNDFLRAVDTWQPDLICLSTTMVTNLPMCERFVREVQRQWGAQAPWILLGGQATQIAPLFWADCGADGAAANLRELRDKSAKLMLQNASRRAAAVRLQ
jgi:methanogenic corrinoid protein MtbC1